MTAINLNNTDRHIFTESIHGASVGVQAGEREIVHVNFSDYKLPHNAEKSDNYNIIREVVNLEMIKDVDGDIDLVLRVYVRDGEESEDLKIIAYKDNGWDSLGGEWVPSSNRLWIGYLQAPIKVGDPPIALGT